MPAFIPLAGPSPNCDAVLVQIEHCAVATNTINKNASENKAFFISVKLICSLVDRGTNLLNIQTREPAKLRLRLLF